MVYEALLLAAVVMLALFIFLFAAQKLPGPVIERGRQVVFLLVTAVYFLHFWSDSGHTLAMKTWRIKLIKPGYARVPLRTALLRHILAWGWFFPALVVCYAFRLTGKTEVGVALLLGVVAWALTAFLDKDRQFLHDQLAGTRLIQLPKPVKKTA